MPTYYAVANGLIPGIYTDWIETKKQVHGFKGAKFKSFPLKAQAEAWLQEYSATAAPGISFALEPLERFECVVVHTYTHMPACLPQMQLPQMQNDAATCGFAAILRYRGNEKKIAVEFPASSEKRLTLMACIESLRLLKKPSKVIIFCATPSIINNIQLGWLYSWRSDKWRKNGIQIEDGDLWQPLSYLLEKHSVQFRLGNSPTPGTNGFHGVNRTFATAKNNGVVRAAKDLLFEFLHPAHLEPKKHFNCNRRLAA